MKCLKFSATWCGPCKAFAPIFHKVSEMSQFNSIEFKEIDVDEDTDDLSGKYGVRGVPSVILLDNDNKVLERLTGTQSEQKFVEVLSKHI